MDSNQLRFVEDTLDLLNDLDEGLLQLEANPLATAPLEQIFRTMHTIKGAANMFGFNNIGALAHELESLFDLVRNGKLIVTDALISITLKGFDRVRDLLQEKDLHKITDDDALQQHIKIAIDFHKLEAAKHGLQVSGVADKDELITYFIKVKPTINITVDGSHPLIFIMLDLEEMGTSSAKVISNQEGISHWHLFLATTHTLSELQSYFLFVEDECEVEFQRLSSTNLLEDKLFQQSAQDFNNGTSDWDKLSEEIPAAEARLNLLQQETILDDNGGTSVVSKKKQADAIIKVSKRKIDDLLDWISELIVLQAQLSTLNAESGNPSLNQLSEHLEMVTNRLRDTSLEIGLVPIETLVTKFKRFVRDLSKSLDKKVNFLSEGADTEMDKDVIEMMSDPMIHLIRNAIDHGITSPEQRKAEGKSEYGTVKLKAFNASAYVNIIISDDGRGIDKDAVLKKAVEAGLVNADTAYTEEEIFDLIFHPGLSTAERLSDISGRGVGMDAVKQKVHELRGSISIKSEKGKGTAFHIKLPLSRSIIEGLLVKVADSHYVVPLNVIERIDRIPYTSLDQEQKVNKTVLINGDLVQVLSLRQRFHSESEDLPKNADVISIFVDGKRKAIAVDRIEGKMQTVLKPLGDVYQQQDFISGSTILGNGALALVLDPSRLFKQDRNQHEIHAYGK